MMIGVADDGGLDMCTHSKVGLHDRARKNNHRAITDRYCDMIHNFNESTNFYIIVFTFTKKGLK